MKARCLTSFFSNNVSGTVGEIIDLKDQETFNALKESGYVEEVEGKSNAKRAMNDEN